MKGVILVDNNLAKYYLTVLRNKNTPPNVFREYMIALGRILALKASDFLSWSRVRVETPLAVAEGIEPCKKTIIVAILGAGVPLAMGMLESMPWAGLGLVAAKRIEDEEGVRITVYYKRLPKDLSGYTAIVTDPMLATGKTMDAVLSILKNSGASKCIIASVIASKQGIEFITSRHPDTLIITVAVDPILDSKWFIVPGLGDAGDRALGVVF